MTGPPPVIVHQREPLGELLEDLAQERILPFHLQIAERHPRNEDQRGPGAGNREGQVGHPGNLGGSDSWEDAGSWRHRRSTRMSCANAR